MKRSVITLLLNVVFIPICFSQIKNDYRFAFGIRAGSDAETCGPTIKFFVSKSLAIETIAGYSNKGIALTSMIEYHFTPFQLKELKLYVGGGAHFNQNSGINTYTDFLTRNEVYQDGGYGYGFDAVGGIEYKFTAAPIAISLDLKPRLDFNQFGDYQMNLDKSIGVKFAF